MTTIALVFGIAIGFSSTSVLVLGVVAWGLAKRGPGPQAQVDAEPEDSQSRMRKS